MTTQESKAMFMKKLLKFCTILSIFIGMSSGLVFAKTELTNRVKAGIIRYKQQNYVGCIQLMQDELKADPSNALAQYYIAISHVRLGSSSQAKTAYQNVITLNTNSILTEASTKAIGCIDNPASCDVSGNPVVGASDAELEAFIQSGAKVNDSIKKDLQKKEVGILKDQINSGKTPTPERLPSFATPSKSQADVPTDSEIAEAVKTLAKIGFNPFAMNNMPNYVQNSELAQVNALFGNNNRSSNSDMMNMLPMLMQSGQNLDPKMMQAMFMSQMIPDFTFDSKRD